MKNKALDYQIDELYGKELDAIFNKLSQLKSGRVYEMSSVSSDGTICHNAEQLERMLSDLLSQIQNGELSVHQKFEMFSNSEREEESEHA